jgi:hypothetical protein
MNPFRTWLLLCGLTVVLGAQSVPAGWQAIKDQKGVCQAAVPGDWKAEPMIPDMFADPKQTASVMLANEHLDKFGARSPQLLEALKPEKVVENSDKRVFLIDKPMTLMNKTTRGWNVWVPAAKGSCHMVVSLEAGADEVLLRKIVDTLAKK